MPGMKTLLRWGKKKKTHHFDVHVNQEGVVWHFFWFSRHPSEDSFFLQ